MPDDSSTEFTRQRRDLFVVSGILLIIQTAGISFVKVNQMGGISVSIAQPEVISRCLWLVWFYWYIRYFQAYKKLGRKYVNEKYNSLIYSYSFPILNERAGKYIAEKIASELPPYNSGNLGSSWEGQQIINNSVIDHYLISHTVDGRRELLERREFGIKGMAFLKLKLKIYMDCSFNQFEFTEYWFPFIFGLLPLVNHIGLWMRFGF